MHRQEGVGLSGSSHGDLQSFDKSIVQSSAQKPAVGVGLSRL